MRRILIYNYWLIIIAWCMFLNRLTLLAILFGLGACVLLMLINRKINYWRMCFVSILSYVTIYLLLIRSNIPYFFSNLYIFLAVICLNLSFTNECLYLFKSKYLKPFLFTMIFSLSVLSIIAFLLPNSLYTLFSKQSLYVMICLIFLPYLIPVAYCIAYKKLINCLKTRQSVKALAMKSQNI